MDYEYSRLMKSYMRSKPKLSTKIIMLGLVLLMVILAVVFLVTERHAAENQKTNVQEFNPKDQERAYSKLTPQYLSGDFAVEYSTKYYCFAVDKTNRTYIVAIDSEQINQYQKLIDYTYSSVMTAPPAEVTLKGMPKEIEEQLVDYMIDGYNSFWGNNAMNASNYRMLVGEYYLDTTAVPTVDMSAFYIFLVCAVVYILIYEYIHSKAKKENKLRRLTLEKYHGDSLYAVDQELNRPDTLHLTGFKLHLTSRYIISDVFGLNILPYEDIIQVYGAIIGRVQRAVMVVTKDGITHKIAVFGTHSAQDHLVEKLVERIKLGAPDIRYGIDAENFYVQEPSNYDIDREAGGRNHMFLGLVGAVFGAALGGVLWIIIGEFGFIAGLAGYLMMIFSIRGYKLLAGTLDKKGQILSLIIAFVMIFAVNCLSYALAYLKGYYNSEYSLANIIASIKAIPDILRMDEVTGSFVKDLLVGYALSIWAGYHLIRSVLSKTSLKSETNCTKNSSNHQE